MVANERANGLTADTFGGTYAPLEQAPSYGVALVLRTAAEAAAVVPALRAAIKEVDPNQPLGEIRTVDQLMAAFVAPDRLRTSLLTAFAAIALLLAGVGVYGVISYSVAQRTREIGIRAALGAGRGRLLGQVMGHAGALAVFGIAIGLGAALLLGRFLSSLLFGVSPRDVTTLAAAGLVLAITAALAAWIPARRASRVDPMAALRAD